MPSTRSTKSTAAPEDPYAPSGWSKGAEARHAEDLVCPSGQRALVRRPGVQGLLAAGVVDRLDTLTGAVNAKHVKRVKGSRAPEIDVKAIANDPKALMGILDIADSVTRYCVLKPLLTASPDCLKCNKTFNQHEFEVTDHEYEPKDADPEAIYIHNVDLEDKMFILDFAVGGTRDLERFRRESAEMLGDVPPVEDVQQPTEQSA